MPDTHAIPDPHPPADLIPIGAFARRSGLTASALRFYDDSGLLRPANVDAASGYRYYHADQLERAVAVRRLRGLEMPLPVVENVLATDPAHAARLIDEHVASLSIRADEARRAAVGIKAALTATDAVPVATVKGHVLAAAIDQVLVATGESDEHPAISGVHIESGPEALTLVATDRYRLSIRTLVPDETSGAEWAGTLDGADLRSVLGELRRRHVVQLEALPDALRFRARESALHCRLASGRFPDHRALSAAVAPPVTRVVVAKASLLAALEAADDETVRLRARPDHLALASPDGAEQASVDAVVDGPDAEVWFGVTVLHPAVATAIGPDLMLDVRGPNEPVTVRSADHGDLATLAMPVEPPLDQA